MSAIMAKAPSRSLATNDVHIWKVSLDERHWQGAAAVACLSRQEQSRAARFRFSRDRQRFIAGHAKLRFILAGYLGCTARQVHYSYGEYGKPAVVAKKDQPPLFFNLAHSQSLALCAVTTSQEVGVDLEYRRPLDDLEGMIGTVCTVNERLRLQALKPVARLNAFFHYWTCKEAFAKATGEGISTLQKIEVDPAFASLRPVRENSLRGRLIPQWALYSFMPAPNYTAALVVQGREHHIHQFADSLLQKEPPRHGGKT